MATRSETLRIEGKHFARAWFLFVGILLMTATIIAIALAARFNPAGGTGPAPVKDDGPAQVQPGRFQQEPISVNGHVCGQCA